MALIRLNSRSAPAATFGGLLQVKSFENAGKFTFSTNNTYGDVTGLDACAITKSDAANLVLIQISIGAWDANSSNNRRDIRLLRNGVAFGGGTAEGNRRSSLMNIIAHQHNRPKPVSHTLLDETGTDLTVTYKLQVYHNTGSNVLGAANSDTNDASYVRTPSRIVLMEIAG